MVFGKQCFDISTNNVSINAISNNYDMGGVVSVVKMHNVSLFHPWNFSSVVGRQYDLRIRLERTECYKVVAYLASSVGDGHTRKRWWIKTCIRIESDFNWPIN